MHMKTYLVIGASGTVGSAVARLLTAQGNAVRAVTSKKERVGREGAVQWVHADLATGEGVTAAFEGAQRALLLAPPGYADHYAILQPLIDEAVRRKLEKVVLMSAMGADAVETSPLRRAEIALEKSGVPCNIVRPNWFMQNFNTFWIQGINEHGKILLPAGQAKTSFIDTRDVAEVLVRLLTTDDRNGLAFNLTGAQALDHAAVADILSRVTGRRIDYQEISPQEMKQGLLSAGVDAGYAEFLVMILGALAQGYASAVTPEVENLIGSKPRSFEQYAQDYRQAWQVKSMV
jgi:uncharacterized protein YbjT (DUF2867 family)